MGFLIRKLIAVAFLVDVNMMINIFSVFAWELLHLEEKIMKSF